MQWERDVMFAEGRPRLVRGAIYLWIVLTVVALCACAVSAQPSASTPATVANRPEPPSVLHGSFGTFEHPYAADSLWNSRPVNPVFGDYVIPTSDYYPLVAEGKFSTGVFRARPSDGPVIVRGMPGKPGVWDPDSEISREITIPHWPADAVPAAASDGHMDIIDPTTGIVHSFWQLKKIDDQWTAALYAWSPLDGRGWPDPAHYYQGARAVGVPASAGLIRTPEINDGKPFYHHALAMSLTYNALSPGPTFVFPATAADATAAKTNHGAIPEGALLMLPPSFDTQSIASTELRKVAETLKIYGARVVDRNGGTPFVIYVEIGSGFNLHRGGWSNANAVALQNIRASLREVKSESGWIDGNGKPSMPDPGALNMLSMRGTWRALSGTGTGYYDTWKQALVLSPTPTKTILIYAGGRSVNNQVTWSAPQVGKRYRLSAIATGGAKLRMVIRDGGSGPVMFDSGDLALGESRSFAWPAGKSIVLTVTNGADRESTIRGVLVGER